MATKTLFTAAEARRIDIERGGEGKIALMGKDCYSRRFNEDTLLWEGLALDGSTVIESSVNILDEEQYSPLTPTPKEVTLENAQFQVATLISQNDKIREKNADLKDAIEILEKELASLKEATRRKSCRDEDPGPQSVLIFNSDKRLIGKGFKSTTSGNWWMHVVGGNIELDQDQTKTWTWKYEADL